MHRLASRVMNTSPDHRPDNSDGREPGDALPEGLVVPEDASELLDGPLAPFVVGYLAILALAALFGFRRRDL